MTDNNKLDQLCVNTIRTLAMDAVEKAKSGHPGMPMGMASPAYTLWTKFLKHNPSNPGWINRDRFVLSAGHGSMLLYSLLYLTGYDLSLDDIKNFRQLNSKTPGHPEYGHTSGVETTTGPLGQGFANGVGMAMAQKHMAAKFNKPEYNLFDYYIYAIVSDGDLMEGISSEAASLAAHLKLGNIIYLFDNNKTTIEGAVNLAFSENLIERFNSYGWQVINVADGNDIDELSKAISKAQQEKNKPSIISVRTIIGYGSPNKQGKSSCHGSPLGPEEVVLAKKNLGWDKPDESFYVPDEALKHFRLCVEKGKESENNWLKLLQNYKKDYPELAEEFIRFIHKDYIFNWDEVVPKFEYNTAVSTRVASGKVLNAIASELPVLIGGSADLAPSNNTYLKDIAVFTAGNYAGRNLHFGVREHAMGAIATGLALSKCLIPYCATFLVFSDYMRNPIRLASLMGQQVIYIFTHDSIAVGEDGPTHQPVEHINSLRSIPGLTVIRPADANETKYAWKAAIENKNGPTALILSRQNLPVIDENKFNSTKNLERGAYIVSESQKEIPDMILIATGSELSLALEAKEQLLKENIDARVVSFPCWQLFEKQTDDYKKKIFPPEITKRIAIEAGSTLAWHKYAGLEGKVIGIDTFGASAPGKTVLKEFGFSAENVVKIAKELI